MKLFLDTNVIIDLLAKREQFYEAIAKIATLADHKQLKLVASSLSFTTVNYVLGRHEAMETVLEKLRKFKIICQVGNVDESIIEKALNSDFKDFEDAVQYFCALDSNCDIIITRNGRDFKKSEIPFMTADEFLSSRNK